MGLEVTSTSYNRPPFFVSARDRDWLKQFEAEHGQPPAEQDWWDYGFASQIPGWTVEDWAATDELRHLLYKAGVRIRSGSAAWSLDEVAVVGRAVRNIARAFGGQVRDIIGGVTIRRTRDSRWPLGLAWTRCAGWEGMGTVRLNNRAFANPVRAAHVLTHELGHYFQESRWLLDEFLEATGGYQFNLLGIAQFNLTPYRYGGEPPNDWLKEHGVYEDFAGSFETFVYHQLGDPIPGNVLDTSRRLFFLQFAASPLSPAPR
jgi:hypothetical protein